MQLLNSKRTNYATKSITNAESGRNALSSDINIFATYAMAIELLSSESPEGLLNCPVLVMM